MFLHLKKYICSPCLDMCMFSKLLKYCIIIQYFQYLMMIMSFSKYLALISVHVTNFCWWNSTLISNIYFLSDILNNQYICGDIFSLWNHIFSQMYFHTLFFVNILYVCIIQSCTINVPILQVMCFFFRQISMHNELIVP